MQQHNFTIGIPQTLDWTFSEKFKGKCYLHVDISYTTVTAKFYPSNLDVQIAFL